MEDNFVGKCLKLNNQLVYIKRCFNVSNTNCYISSCLLKLKDNLGYKSCPDIITNVHEDYLIDSSVYDKIYKLLKINFVTCNSILKLAEKPNRFTGYTKCMFPIDCYKLFHSMGRNTLMMVKFSADCAYISIEEPKSLMYEKLSLSTEEQILPETYERVRDTLVDTINQINKIWISI